MERQLEPTENKIVAQCGFCLLPLEEGEQVIKYGGEIFCDEECVIKELKENCGLEEVVLGDDGDEI